ncbi:MAG: glycosyltransferase [Caldilineaceae bacterium]
MIENELVSIIIPNYNHARYLGDAIESALAQSYTPREVIVLDDGSTDNSREVAMHFSGYIDYIHQENRGLAPARNAAIRAATGKYVALLDADDAYEKHFVGRAVDALRSQPTARGVYTGYSFIDQKNHPLPQLETRVLPAKELHKALLFNNFLVPACVFVERDCYVQSNLFDERLSACADWDMWLRLSNKYEIVGLPEALVRYRIVVGSMSSNPQRMLNERLAVLEKHVGAEPPATDPNDRVRRAYAEAYFRAVIEFLQNENAEQAETYLHRAAALYPPLIQQRDTLFELLLGGQPRGIRGNLSQLEITSSCNNLLTVLDNLFDDAETGLRLAPLRNTIYAQAYSIIASAHYARNHFSETRHFLMRSALADHDQAVNRQHLSMFAKSLLGTSLVNRFRRRSVANSYP